MILSFFNKSLTHFCTSFQNCCRIFVLMKLNTVLLLLIVMLHAAFRDATVYVSFKLRQDYIARQLCVYRDVPLSMCKGSCYLRAQLAEQHRSNSALTPNTQQELVWLQFEQLPELPEQAPLSAETQERNYRYQGACLLGYNRRFFPPPKQAKA